MSRNEEYDSVASSESENDEIEAPKVTKAKVTKQKSKPDLIIDTQFDDDEIEPTPRQRGRPRKQPVKKECPDEPPKPKRVQTEAQKANFQKCLETRKQKIAMRNQEKAELAAAEELKKQEKQADVERKILKKAVVIKKKQIIKEAILDEISDDEIPTEVVQKIIKKQQAKKAVVKSSKPVEPPAPKYTFVY
jgi:hypothetical protein